MNKLCAFFLFFCTFSFSQNLEEQIYVAAETFMADKNEKSFEILIQKENQFKNQATTKNEHLALVFLLCHKGFYLDLESKLKAAITTFEDAFKRFNQHQLSSISDFDIIESCMKPLGNLYTKIGDFTNAESTIKQYIFLAEKNKNTKHQISGAINLAKLYQTLGRHETVLKLTSEYAEHPNATTLQKQKLIEINADSQMALGLISSHTDFPKFLDSEQKYKMALQNGNYKEALLEFKKAKNKTLSEGNLSNRSLAKLYVEEAQLHVLLNQNDKATESLNTATTILIPNFKKDSSPKKSDLYAENTFMDIFDLYAEIAPNTETALYYFDLSFYVSELLRSSWTAQETKILNQSATRIRSEKCIDLLFSAYKKTKNDSIIFKALQYAENSKASTLIDMFLKKQRLKKFPNDTLLQNEYRLLKNQEHITSLLVKEQLGDNRISKINEYNKTLSQISLDLKTLKQAIYKVHPSSQDPFSLLELQQKLQKDKAVLIEYFYGKNHIYQFVVSKNNIDIIRIQKTQKAEKDIINFINLFNKPSTINNDIQNFTNRAFGIFKLLNLQKIINHKNVLLITDGLLNFIPFDALLTNKTTTTVFENMPFVARSNRLAFAASITMYLNTEATTNNKSVLGIFPIFEGSSQALSFSKAEAEVLRDEMEAKILMHTEASKHHFIEKGSHYDILHLSTHAQSGDFVNPASISFYDEPLTLNALYALDLNSNLVVLSACETGIGKLYKSEGAMSIARGFQYAGAQSLLFSLWQINDLSTSQIMQSFYTNFGEHQSAFTANSQSKLEYLKNESISNIKKSPYYWSAFVYYGPMETKKTKNFNFYTFFGIIILLIALFLFFKRKKHGGNTSTIPSR